MKIIFIRELNPFYESSASANRYEGLLKGLTDCGAEIEVYITGGYNCLSEYKEIKKLQTKNIKFIYLFHWINFQNIWLKRFSKYILVKFKRIVIDYKLRNIFKSNCQVIWLSNSVNILNSFNKYKHSIVGSSMIELNEYNDLYENETHYKSKIQYNNALREDLIFKNAIKNIDLIAIMTLTLMDHYKKMAKKDAKFFHLPMTVDFSRFNINPSEKFSILQPYIAYTGTFNNQKDGVDVLIKSFAKVANQYPTYKLYLAGFYYYDVEMQKKIISNYGLDDRIIYLGILDKEEIPSFLSNAELLVMARPNSRQAEGGFPTKLGEYLATGKPVCVTNVGEISNYLTDNFSAYIAEPGNVESFADAIYRALSNKKNSELIGFNGQKVALDNFSISVQSKRLYRFIENNINE